jgi:ribosome-associated toxin RatA of RatAB toxin-antitoxin module
MGEITKSVTVAAPSDRILEILLAVEDHPSWQKEVSDVEVLERDERGRPAKTKVHISAMGQTGWYVVQYSYPDSNRFEYKLVDGDMMTKNDAAYEVKPREDGASEVEISMAMDLKWSLPQFMIDQVTLKGVKDMLKNLKGKAEQGA